MVFRPPSKPKKRTSQLGSFPAPVAGWIKNRSLATPQVGPQGAELLENWFPTATGATLRRGSSLHATLPDADDIVWSMFTYSSGGTEQLFAANASAIYDVTVVGTATEVLGSQTGGDWSVVQFATLGGVFLVGVNGVDPAFLYDGTDFYPLNDAAVNNLPYTYTSAPWKIGQVVTGATSGATATIVGVSGGLTGTLRLGAITGGPFVSGEDITSPTSSLAIGRNRLIRSQEFDNEAWAKSGATITANATTAPDGTITADKFVESATNSNHLASQSATITGGSTVTISVYAKAAERSVLRLRLGDSVGFLGDAVVDLNTGATTGGAQASDVGGGWWRVSFSKTTNLAATTVTHSCWIYLTPSTQTYLGDGVSGLYLWGAQLEVGSAVTPYEKTAAAVRTTMVAVSTGASSVGSAVTITFPATHPTLTTADLCFVWNYKQRLYFVEKESLNVWYLPADQIGGELVFLPLGGVMPRGGTLVFGETWSLDAGARGGLSEQCIFVTSEGEVAVYQGLSPNDAASWSKVGFYRIGDPLGPKAWIRAGGDIIIATKIGMVPVSQAVQRDVAALSRAAVSYPIEEAWNEAVSIRTGNWACTLWPDGQMMVVAPAYTTEETPRVFVANARTGAWAPFTGWDARCLCVFQGGLYFGSAAGRVVQANVTGADEGVSYTGKYVPLFNDMGEPASLKIAEMARHTLRTGVRMTEGVTCQFDFDTLLPNAPDAPNIGSLPLWDSGTWDESLWSSRFEKIMQMNWYSVGGTGYALAPSLQVTSGAIVPLDVEIIKSDVTYQVAQIVS